MHFPKIDAQSNWGLHESIKGRIIDQAVYFESTL